MQILEGFLALIGRRRLSPETGEKVKEGNQHLLTPLGSSALGAKGTGRRPCLRGLHSWWGGGNGKSERTLCEVKWARRGEEEFVEASGRRRSLSRSLRVRRSG